MTTEPITVPDLAVDLAEFATDLRVQRLSGAVVDAAKMNIGDTLSCALAGSSALGVAEVSSLVREWGGAPQASLLVLGGRVPAHHAAWVNSAMCHARDYDDTHDAAMLHAGVSTVPAAIAAAQLRGTLSGADLIAAVAAGLEVTCRLGTAVEVDIVETGFIYSSLLGYFGATAAAGRAFGLTQDEMASAFGIVYSSVAGNHQVTRDASLMKRLQPGLAAQAAVVAVQLARRGIQGPHGVFEGTDGFFRVYLQGRVSSDNARADLGTRFELMNLSYKPYPCCRDTHAAVDAVLELRRLTQRPGDDIESIRVGLTSPGYQMVCVPEAVRLAPRTIVEAQFSIPYAVAAAWIDGGLGISHFADDALRRPDVLTLASRVQPFVDDEFDRDWRRVITPAKVSVHFRDGQTVQARVDYSKGHPRNPMTPREFAAKTRDCAAVAMRPLSAEAVDRFTSTISELESIRDVATLVQTLVPGANSVP